MLLLSYDHTSFAPQLGRTPSPAHGAMSGSEASVRHPWVRNTGQNAPNWYLGLFVVVNDDDDDDDGDGDADDDGGDDDDSDDAEEEDEDCCC